MLRFFDKENYRDFLRWHLAQKPQRGRGEMLKIAKHLRVHPTLLSQIMAGQRNFTEDQAFEVAEYLGLNSLETEYFQCLVQVERAATLKYRKFLLLKLTSLREEALRMSKRFDHDRTLSEEERATFYSSWIYSAVRLYCSLGDSGQSIAEISQFFRMSDSKSREILKFLTKTGLCVESAGRYKMGTQRTFVDRGSVSFLRHHSNWRLRSIARSENLSQGEMMFTAPMTISREDFKKIREDLAQLLSNVSKVAKDSVAEDLACLNVDFFFVKEVEI